MVTVALAFTRSGIIAGSSTGTGFSSITISIGSESDSVTSTTSELTSKGYGNGVCLCPRFACRQSEGFLAKRGLVFHCELHGIHRVCSGLSGRIDPVANTRDIFFALTCAVLFTRYPVGPAWFGP